MEAKITNPETLLQGTATRTSRGNLYIASSFLALAIVIFAFSPTYVVPMAAGTFKGSALVHVHGMVFITWMLLFIAQPLLVRTKNITLHRKIGVAGFVLAAVMVLMGTVTAIVSARNGRAGGSPFSPATFLIIPLSDMVLFAGFIIAALINLKKPETHKRLMLLATVAILPAAFGRITSIFNITSLPVTLLMLESLVIIGILYDLVQRRSVHKIYILGGLIMLVVHTVRVPVGTTDTWLSVARWLTK